MEALPVMVLVSLQAFLLKSEGAVETDGWFVVCQRLAAELMQSDVLKCITQGGLPHAASRSLRGVW